MDVGAAKSGSIDRPPEDACELYVFYRNLSGKARDGAVKQHLTYATFAEVYSIRAILRI